MTGLHIIADFLEVNFNINDFSEDNIKIFISNSLIESNLNELGSYYHKFNNNNEVTGVIALAESHISFHTWPEDDYISLDIFVCNHSNDNSLKAKMLYQKFKDYFKPKEIKEQFINR